MSDIHPDLLAQRKPAPTIGRLLRWRLELERLALLRLSEASERRRAKKTPRHLLTGLRGELEALFFLRARGFLFVERRWRAPELRGDLDLIGWDGATLVFVEVKTRTAHDFAAAESSVDNAKQRMLRRMARAYRRTLPRGQRDEIPIRFDLVSVYLLGPTVECELIRGAFPAVEPEREYGERWR